jgi:hypothetical protein
VAQEGHLSIRVIRNAQASWQGTVPDEAGRIGLLSGTEIALEASLAGS